MSNLIENKYGSIRLHEEADMDPIFVFTFVDDNGKADDCEYGFTFKGNKICLYGWHFGVDTEFTYEGNWMDNCAYDGAFHDHDYQDFVVERLRLCIKEVLNNITGLAPEYL